MAISTTNDYNDNSPSPKGILVIIGGKENKGKDSVKNEKRSSIFCGAEILKNFVELIEKDDPVIEVITSASSIGNELFEEYKKVFTGLGVKHINHIHHHSRDEVLDDNLAERINNASAFFFSGGDQFLLTSLYEGTTLLKHLKERYIKEKIVIGGTSAGAMALSTPMIYIESDNVKEHGAEVKVTTGLGFMRDICIDTHFVHRHRFVRLAKVIAANPVNIGIGVDEDTAMIIRNGQAVEIIGSGTIIFFDGCEISETNIGEGTKKPILMRNLKVHILSKGDAYQLKPYQA